jgi:hypothetical protein
MRCIVDDPPREKDSMQVINVVPQEATSAIQNKESGVAHGVSGASPLEFTKKVTLENISSDSPSIVSLNDRLYIAWKGDVVNKNINIMCLDENGHAIGEIFKSQVLSTQAPVLCTHKGMLFLSWACASNGALHVARVDLTNNRMIGLSNQVILTATSLVKFSMASFNGALYIAWKSAGNQYLNLMHSTDDGAKFSDRYTSSETTMLGPGLAAHGRNLYITWTNNINSRLNVALVDFSGNLIIGLANKVILPDISPDSPSLASLRDKIYILWRGDVSRSLSIECSVDNGASFRDKCRYLEASHYAPALCAHNGSIFVSWTGRENGRINVARI